jgi:cytoskeletal protein RodZ
MASNLPISPTEPIGSQLQARRKQLRLSLAQIEMETKIRGKFLTALESGQYDSLPNDIYTRGFVQHYANHLGMDGQLVSAAYQAERGAADQAHTGRPQLARTRRLVFTGPLLAAFTGLLAIGAIVAYLVWQFTALAAAPHLILTSPDNDVSLTGSVVNIAGSTTPGSDVTVNDSPVLTDTNGGFSEKVALKDGVNVIRVTAKSKLGKSTVVTRNVLAKLPSASQTVTSVPLGVIDGVAIQVTIKQTTSLVVIGDGKELFRGTVLGGNSLLFGGVGTTSIKLTTGNAGATSVMVTNTLAAGKKLDKLGADGEIRQNQEFAKDTVFQ